MEKDEIVRKVIAVLNGQKICSHCNKPTKYELYICKRCDEHYCDNCSAYYTQFTQINYNCCASCADNEKDMYHEIFKK